MKKKKLIQNQKKVKKIKSRFDEILIFTIYSNISSIFITLKANIFNDLFKYLKYNYLINILNNH